MGLKAITDTATTPALALLPAVMETSAASVMLLAIGLQESRVMLRREIGSPVRGFGLFGKDGFALPHSAGGAVWALRRAPSGYG